MMVMARRWVAGAALALAAAAAGCSAQEVMFTGEAGAPDAGGTAADGAPGGEGGTPIGDVMPADAWVITGPPDGPPPVTGCMPEGERKHAVMDSPQVSSTAGVTYNSNPPSSGPHCGAKGAYGNYPADMPLDRCYWIKNLARGDIAIVYNCPDGCPEIQAQVARAFADIVDPDCSNTKRVLVTPYPALDVRVAAVAWGYTWKSGCLDGAARESLVAFINAHIGSKGEAPERTVDVCK